jgi:hypothetical protein
MKKHSAEWWIGQAVALYLGIAAIGVWGGTAGAIVVYALFVLVDIREYARASTDRAANEGPNAGAQATARK